MNHSQDKLTPIAFAIDKSFVLPLRNALRSLARVHTGSEDIGVTVISTEKLDGISSDVLRDAVAINTHISLSLKQVPLLVPELNASSEINHAAYLRLSIPNIFDTNQVVYLDADILFASSPVELLRIRPDNHTVIMATQDVQNPTLESGIAMPGWQELGIEGNARYFNSGVMIINTKKWNKDKISEKAIEFVRLHPKHLRFKDQDVLNYLLRDKWQDLPLIWNYPPLSIILKVEGFKYYAENIFPLQSILDAENDAKIMHFVGSDKPWQDDFPSGHVTDLYRELTR